jgi:SAM-dependent methyltransferase
VSERKLTAYDVAGHYDAQYFDELSARYRRRNRFARQRIANVLTLLPAVKGRRVVDLGCGMGTFTIETARRGAVAIGIDPAPPALAAARVVARAEAVSNASFVRADAVHLPLAAASADVVLAADVTEHLDDDTLAAVLAEARRVLRADGRLVLYTPDHAHLFERLRERKLLAPDPSHIAIRSATDLENAVARAGFRVLDVRHLPSHLPVWNLVERALQRRVPLFRRRIGLVASPE